MIALPSYQDYTKRAYVAEGLNLANGMKIALAEIHANSGNVSRDQIFSLQGDTIKGQAVGAIWTDLSHNPQTNDLQELDIYIFYNQKVVPNADPIPTQWIAFADVVKRNNYLMLAADMRSKGTIQWKCYQRGSALLSRWLPSNCRSELINK